MRQKRLSACGKGWGGERGGFTLVEILIVVVILGILAAIAVPKLSNASQMARDNSLKETLRLMRTQIGVYRSNHLDIAPGYPGGDVGQTATSGDFVNQLTEFTDGSGNVSATATGVYKFGPYVQRMPVDPVNYLGTVKIMGPGDALTPDGTTGWMYQPDTGVFKANMVGADGNGVNYGDY